MARVILIEPTADKAAGCRAGSPRPRAAIAFALVSILTLMPAVGVSGQSVPKVLGLEAGYGYVTSSSGLNPNSASGLIAGLRYGYLILDRPSTSALLSLALGYSLFPQGAGGSALQSVVYGLEYEHLFLRRSPVALSVEYGLLFDLLLEGGRKGYAFGHHTRLGLGPSLKLGEKDDLELLVDYNIVSFPYFELSSGKFSYPSVALRYRRQL